MYDILFKFSQFFFQAQITPGSSDHRLGLELSEWPMCDGRLRAHRAPRWPWQVALPKAFMSEPYVIAIELKAIELQLQLILQN